MAKKQKKKPTARVTTSTGSSRSTRSVGGSVRNNQPSFRKVNLRLHRVECVKTTKEIDRDEIVLAAIKAEGQVVEQGGRKKLAAKAKKSAQIVVGKFKKGDVKRYKKPKLLASFNSGGVRADWPRHYNVVLLMIEEDEGAIGTIVNKAVKSIEKELKAVVTTAATGLATSVAAGALAGSVVPLVGTAVGAAAGAALTLATTQIMKSRADDVFKPRRVNLRLSKFPSKAGEIKKETKLLVGHGGKYKVTYSWAVVK